MVTPARPGSGTSGLRTLPWGQVLALIAGVVFFALTVHWNPQFLQRAASGPVDLMPLLLGAKALVAGLNPNDPAVLESIYLQSADITVEVHGFHSYYPPTASLLMLPLAWLPYQWISDFFYWGGMTALVATAAVAASAGRRRGPLALLAATLLVGAVFLNLRLARVVLPSGQVSPFVVLLTVVAARGLARDRSPVGLLAFLAGGALKYVPLLLLPLVLARRRWRWLAGFVVLALVIGMCILYYRDGPGGLTPKWLLGGRRFVMDRPAWMDAPEAWMVWMWRFRTFGLGTLTLGLVGVAAWRRAGLELTLATAGLLLAWGGANMAGGVHYHESLTMLPALALVLCWPAQRGPWPLQWGSALLILAAMWKLGAFARLIAPNHPHWLPLAYLIWCLMAVRWGWALWVERGDGTIAAQPVRSR
jgi:hypothetical protein